MATVKFYTRGKSNPANIYIRFVAGRQFLFRVVTPLSINPNFFNNKTGTVRKVASYKEKDKLQSQLNELSDHIINQYNNDLTKGNVSGSGWLKDVVNSFFNIGTDKDKEKEDLNLLLNYAKHYTDNLRIKHNDKTGAIGMSESTIKKYRTITKKIQAFEKHTRRKYSLVEVNTKFRNDILNYFLDVEKYSRNTAGRYIKFIKTICLDAQKSGYNVSPELNQIKGFTVKVDKIYLTFDELAKIESLNLDNEKLEDAKDWLIIGCYIGQRAGDLLNLTKENITQNGNLNFIELVQKKTKKKVSVMIPPKVHEILDKRGGSFPKSFGSNIESAKTIFNLHIKEVCRLAGLNQIVSGSKVNPKTNRKEAGKYPKYELVTSHICRRSFATNLYGEIPTPLIMHATGHGTEREFLNYIGKTNIDYAEQMAKYWNTQSQMQDIKEGKQSPLRVAK